MQKTDINPTELLTSQDKQQPVDIIIPFYKHAELVSPLFDALCSLALELQKMQATLILINDSPMDLLLQEALATACLRCKKNNIIFKMLINDENLGFLRTANRGLQLAAQSGHDVILLNSDTIPTRGSLPEIQRIAYSDNTIGFVSPRSNNAVHCSFPNNQRFMLMDFGPAYDSFKKLQSCLPEITYIPTVVGFCMYIKSVILQKIGFLDEIYGHGYYEEYDYVFRASRHGYKAALANHAYVYHKGSASIASIPTYKETLLKKNRLIFENRYPEYISDMQTYLSSSYYKAESLLHGLLKDKNGTLDIIFDFSDLGFLFSKRANAAQSILKTLSENNYEGFNFFVKCSRATWIFYKLYKLQNVHLFSAKNSTGHAISCRVIGNYPSLKELIRMSNMAVHNIYFILKDNEKKAVIKRAKDKEYLSHFLFNYAHSTQLSYEPKTQQSGLRASTKKLILDTQILANLFIELIHHSDLNINNIILRMEQLALLQKKTE